MSKISCGLRIRKLLINKLVSPFMVNICAKEKNIKKTMTKLKKHDTIK